jgi:hypothetical protein
MTIQEKYTHKILIKYSKLNITLKEAQNMLTQALKEQEEELVKKCVGIARVEKDNWATASSAYEATENIALQIESLLGKE